MPPAFVLLLRRFAWVSFAVATAWFAMALPQQAVDAQNRALKSPDSVEARRLRELANVVPADPVVLVAFAAPGSLELPADHRATIAALAKQLAAVDGVIAVTAAPAPDAGLVLLAIAVRRDDELAVAEAVLAVARPAAPPGVRVLAAGLPLVEGTIARLVAAERTRVVPLLVVALFAVAWLAYRRAALAVAALLPALCAIAWTSGLLARLGHRLDPIAALLDPVLLTIGVATSVHVLGAWRRATAAAASAETAVAAALAEVKTPAMLAAATTMVGLWSLATSDVPAVVDFGVRSAFGVGLTHLFAFTLLPPLLLRLRPAPLAAAADERMSAAWRLLATRRASVLMVAAAGSALAIAGLSRLRADNDVLRLLPRDESVRQDVDELAARLGGIETFHLLAPPRSPAEDPTRLLPLVAALREQPGIAGLAGPAVRGRDGELAVPLLLRPGGSAARTALFDDVERITATLGLDDVVPAGPSVQLARDSHRLLRSLLGNIALSLALLAGGMALGLRSWRLAMVGIAPNVMPSLWLYGGLGWLDRPVGVATAMIGCTMLGLVVDNTIHLLHRFQALRAGGGRDDAMQAAWLDTIRPMTLASAVLGLGFGTAVGSRLSTTAEFGALAAATIATAWFGTAVLLPAAAARQPAPHGDVQ